MFNRLFFSCQSGLQCSLQLLIQPWIRAPGSHCGWVDQGSVEYKVCPTIPHTTCAGDLNPNLVESNTLSTWPRVPTKVPSLSSILQLCVLCCDQQAVLFFLLMHLQMLVYPQDAAHFSPHFPWTNPQLTYLVF